MISERGFLSCSVEASAAERSGPARRSHFCIRTLRALSWRCLWRSKLLDFEPSPSFGECGACLREQEPVVIAVDYAQRVTGLLQAPPQARACLILAHGAGAGMSHPFMAAVAEGFAERGIASLRYQFPYMERGGKRPDAPARRSGDGAGRCCGGGEALSLAPLCRGGQIIRRPDDVRGAGGLPSPRRHGIGVLISAFHCTPPGNPPRIVRAIFSKSKFRCCSCRGHVMLLRISQGTRARMRPARFARDPESF